MSQIKYVFQKNAGVSAARNRGLRDASSEFVAFLDADDVWHPRKLEMQLAILNQDAALCLLGTGSFDWPTLRVPECSRDEVSSVEPVTWKQLTVKNHFTTSSVVVRRSILEDLELFDTALQGPEDRDLWLRIAERSKIGNISQPLTGYRTVPGSVSKQSARCREGMLRILQKLDARRAWGGDFLLRRKAYSYVYHSAAYLFHCDGANSIALLNSMKSLSWYPLPYRRSEVKTPLERPRRIINIMLRSIGLKRVPSLT